MYMYMHNRNTAQYMYMYKILTVCTQSTYMYMYNVIASVYIYMYIIHMLPTFAGNVHLCDKADNNPPSFTFVGPFTTPHCHGDM